MRKKTEEAEETTPTENIAGEAPTTEDPKAKILALAMSAIEKDFGQGTVMVGQDKIPGLQYISSGSITVDKALGGGYARGRMIEIVGPESSGKSTMALHATSEAQKTGLKVAYLDIEHSLDPQYSSAIGVNMDELIFSQPSCGEEALEVMRRLVATGAVGLIILDSIAGLVPRKELEGQVGDAQMGRQALMMSQACRMLAPITYKTNTTIIWLNQIRMKLNVMFGSPEVSCGGQALKFYASQRLDIRRTGGVKDGEEIIANDTRVKVIKNKVAPPFKEATFRIKFGVGIDIWDDLLTVATNQEVIHKAGAWYDFQGERIGQGSDNACQYLREHPELVEKVKGLLK